MADKTKAEALVEDILAKVEATTSSLSDAQADAAREIARSVVAESRGEFEQLAKARKFEPDTNARSMTDGTRYARLGLSDIDVQMAYGILTDAQRTGLSKRGPSEELGNLARAIQDRAAADDQVSARAMDTSDTSSVIGSQYMTDMWRAASMNAVIAPLIRSFPMANKTAYIPVFGAPPVPVAYDESTIDDSADYDTQDTTFSRVSVTAAKFGLHQKWSGEIEEESIVPFVSALRERVQLSMAHYGDDIILNGDTTLAATGNVNSDDAQLASNDRRVKFDGIRKGAIVDNTAQTTNAGGTLTYAHLTGLRKLCIDRTRLTSWGNPANPRDFVYLVNPEGMDVIANLDELITWDKYQNQATVFTGEVASVGQNPLLVSMAVPLTEADGKCSTTSSNNTLSQVVAFNVNALSIGILRQMTTETYRLPYRDQNGIVMFWRMGLARYTPTGAASGIEWAAAVRNFS